ncbi:PorP/SprF family type IX secretion system membrane protein [Gaoshiqia sediminis]|uniref:PorP/SprF family type IX secretion system membrane protein n=1 Tax=Gaoshiqia sediminis TaxID=2986998 RepID=A0AA42C5Y4_9BACT|nr:PorP/SprF family type IX secretion system membrane protein [Gaoshiqia sediminis]MCW0483348.1 PorP/SprF family type IX secretion system membrane protein [Gaoshiqia sediminis]
MLKPRAFLFLLLMLLGGQSILGQDVSFSQYYANPLCMNPAFAGSGGATRIALHYRDQWQKFDDAYTTYSAAIDLPVNALQGGLGIYLLNDGQAGNILNSFQLDLAYSVFIRLNEQFRLNAGIQGGYHQNSLKTNELIFADNLDIYDGTHGTSSETITDPNFEYADFSSGFLVFSKRLFMGGAIHHLNEPRQSFSPENDDSQKLNRKYTAHVGAKLPVFRHGLQRKKFDISPQLILQKQGISKQINYGMLATRHGLTAGAWFRQNFGIRYDAVILLAGFMTNRMQFTYSYDWTISGLWGNSGGTSEVSVSFLLKGKRESILFPFFSPYEEEFGVR